MRFLFFLIFFLTSLAAQAANPSEDTFLQTEEADEQPPEIGIDKLPESWQQHSFSTDYKSINPAEKHEKIAIVGGGISGLYMASLLKEVGYSNITVFDSGTNKKIRGMKFKSKNGKSYWMPQGAIQISPGYLITGALASKYNIPLQKHHPVSEMKVAKEEGHNEVLNFRKNLLPAPHQEYIKFTNAYEEYVTKFNKLVASNFEYKHWNPLFAKSLNDLLLQVLKESKAKLSLNQARSLFALYLRSYGYGDNPTAYSVLSYVGSIRLLVPHAVWADGHLRLIRGGFQRIVNHLKEEVKDCLHEQTSVVSLTKIPREGQNPQVSLEIQKSGQANKTLVFDRVVVAAPFKQFVESGAIQNPNPWEQQIARDYKNEPYRTVQATVEHLPRGFFILTDNLKKDGYPTLIVNNFDKDCPENFATFYIPEHQTHTTEAETVRKLKETGAKLGLGSIDVHSVNIWNNFSAYFHNRVQENLALSVNSNFQGKEGIYYHLPFHDTVEPNLRFVHILFQMMTGKKAKFDSNSPQMHLNLAKKWIFAKRTAQVD